MRQWQPRGGGIGFGMGMTPAVKSLLIANGVVFVLQTLLGGGLSQRLGLVGEWMAFIPHAAINDFQIWRFFTYMFLHGGLFHIGINMFLLWMFGSQIEQRWGRNSFLLYYVICGLGGALTYGVFNLVGIESWVPMLGASGAVFGILLAYGMIFPDAVILVMMIFPMKAKYAVILFGLIELWSMASGSQGGVAHLAHLGGMITGFIFLRVTIPSLAGRMGNPAGGLGAAWKRYRTKSRMRVVRPDDKSSNGNGRGGYDRSDFYRGGDSNGNASGKSPEQQRIDLILDKISREGLDSLTDEEQDILRRAGRR